MPRPHADTVQVTFRIPSHWLEQADALALVLAAERGITATRTDVFREAIVRGFEAMQRGAGGHRETQYRVSAWDGRATRCLFWFGESEKEAVAEAKRLAKQHATSGEEKWTVFRVYRGDEQDPILVESVHDAGKPRKR